METTQAWSKVQQIGVALVFIMGIGGWPNEAAAQSYFGLRVGHSDFRLDDVAQSFVTQSGNLVEVVKERFAGSSAIGADMVYLDGRMSWNIGAEYRSANVFGNSGFELKYSGLDVDVGEPVSTPTENATQIDDLTEYFRSTVGFGVNLVPQNRWFFFYVNPNLDVQYGRKLFLKDAFRAVADGGVDVDQIRIESSLLLGFVGRVNAGIWLDETVGLALSPGFSWVKRFEETLSREGYSEVTASGSSMSYEFTVSLLVQVDR